MIKKLKIKKSDHNKLWQYRKWGFFNSYDYVLIGDDLIDVRQHLSFNFRVIICALSPLLFVAYLAIAVREAFLYTFLDIKKVYEDECHFSDKIYKNSPTFAKIMSVASGEKLSEQEESCKK